MLYLHPGDGPQPDHLFLEMLCDMGLDVHAPVLPGFGASDRPGDMRSVGDLARFAGAYLDERDLEDSLVIGASFGGWVAADLVSRNSTRIKGLALIGALGVKFGGREERDVADFHSLDDAELKRRLWADPANAPQAEAMDEATAMGAARSEEAFALYGWRPYMHDPSLPRWLRRVQTPTLVLWGDADGIVTTEYGRDYAALFPKGAFETVAGAGHYPAREQPAATAARVAGFAARL